MGFFNSPELKPIKVKLKELFDHLMIDKELSIKEIKLIIKNRRINLDEFRPFLDEIFIPYI